MELARSAMAVRLPSRPLTLDDVATLAAADDTHRYELVEGNLLVMPPADAEHAAIIMQIGSWLLTAGCSPGMVLATPGLRVSGQSSGRSPDVVVLRRHVPAGTVWVEPDDVLLTIEVVSPGSENIDRKIKPSEYATAGIEHFWRVERSGRAPTVHMYTLGTDAAGAAAYVGHEAQLLEGLLNGPPPLPIAQ